METFSDWAIVIAVTIVFIQSIILHRAMRRIVTLGSVLSAICAEQANSQSGQAGAELAGNVSEETLRLVARDLSLGLDCNVPVMACREASRTFFRQ